jgi:hypothetical protein
LGQTQVLRRSDPRRIDLRPDRRCVLPRLQREVDERGEHRHRAEQLTECPEVLDGQQLKRKALLGVIVATAPKLPVTAP